MTGEQILNYKIVTKIGEGGMGSVFLGQHIQLGRKAAIKALHPNLVSNPMIRERFKNEAATMAHLRHPNIVGLYDYLETTNGLYLIMEYVQGKPLDEYIHQISGPIPEANATELFIQILDGFEYAHNQGVVHRDIKPSNLIITPELEVKILDFGIAKLLDGSSKSLTQAGSRMGTILYMSPEQVKGQEVDRRSDIYALGITLFQMLTGRSPYNEQTATEYEIYNQIVNHPLPKAQSFYPKVSARMQSIIDQATSKMPYERFQSCAEFKRVLLGENYLSKSSPNYANMGMGKTPPVAQNMGNNLNNGSQNQLVNDKKTVVSTKIKRQRRNFLITSILLFLLVCGAAAFILLNPLDWPELRKYAVVKKPLLVSEEPKIREKVKAFFEAVEMHNFQNIKAFYADTLETYFTFSGVSLIPDVKASYETDWKTFVEERNTINWESMKYETDEQGNHTVTLTMKYEFLIKDQEWDFMQRTMEIKLNPDLKIFSIRKL